jgi:hypothetical protein
MLQAIGQILPISVTVALSSVPIMAMILILLSPNQKRSGLPFLIGWVLGLAIVVVAFTLVAHALPASTARGTDVLAGIIEIILGIAVVALALISWRRSVDKPTQDMPRWLMAAGKLGPWSAFGVAFILNLRPKGILLSAATGLSLRDDSLSAAETAVVLGVYTLISASTVAVPIIATLVAPVVMGKRLVATRAWMTRNNRTVSIIILLLIGVVIIGNGLTRL